MPTVSQTVVVGRRSTQTTDKYSGLVAWLESDPNIEKYDSPRLWYLDAREWIKSIKVVRVVGIPDVEHASSQCDSVRKPKASSDVPGLVAPRKIFVARD